MFYVHATNPHTEIVLLIVSCIFVLGFPEATHGAKFQPYELNGGLISAVAGKNYILLASDTRLSENTDILSRKHLESRLYKVSSHSYPNEDSILDSTKSVKHLISFNNQIRIDVHDGILLGSSGCASDCEDLKRTLQYQIKSQSYFFPKSGASSISQIVSQVLYSRRSFPFYSFCVTAGFDDMSNTGEVHVYDAIGSHECVSVAACGVGGMEMLQPVLDRLFSESEYSINEDEASQILNGKRDQIIENVIPKDGNVVKVSKQRNGLSLLPPVKTYVDCDSDEAVELLVRAYRSVSEREISVGDDLIICIMKRDEDNLQDDLNGSLEIRRFPLRKH